MPDENRADYPLPVRHETAEFADELATRLNEGGGYGYTWDKDAVLGMFMFYGISMFNVAPVVVLEYMLTHMNEQRAKAARNN